MSRVEVLVATMNQTDLSLFEKMNIQTDVIFCNQCDRNEFIDTEINGCRVRMLSTTTRGVGTNRNLAMQLSNAEFCLCADDDIIYVDGYEQIICSAFDNEPKASLVEFNRVEEDGTLAVNCESGYTKKGAGACRIAYKNNDIKFANIKFTELFGGGTKYSAGEDSLFIKDVSKQGLKIYFKNEVIGKLVATHDSTWFNGYTDKYFFDKGAWCKACYPTFWRILKYYLIFGERNNGEQSIIKKIKLYNLGAKAFKNKQVYGDKHES